MFESLKLTIERTLPYWNDVIVPQVSTKISIVILSTNIHIIDIID